MSNITFSSNRAPGRNIRVLLHIGANGLRAIALHVKAAVAELRDRAGRSRSPTSPRSAPSQARRFGNENRMYRTTCALTCILGCTLVRAVPAPAATPAINDRKAPNSNDVKMTVSEPVTKSP